MDECPLKMAGPYVGLLPRAVLFAALPLCLSCSSLRPDVVLRPDGRPRPCLTAVRHAGINLDGDLSDWSGIRFTHVTPRNGIFCKSSTKTDSARDLSYRFAVCQDGKALYVAVDVTDDVLKVDSTKPGDINARAWEDDAVEVFIDGNYNRAPDARVGFALEFVDGIPEARDGKISPEMKYGGEFSLVINGAATSTCSGYPNTFGLPDGWQGATKFHAVRKGAKRLLYEFRIPLAMMGEQVRPGQTVGFTIAAQDDDDSNPGRDHALYWSAVNPGTFRDERGWGDLVLEP